MIRDEALKLQQEYQPQLRNGIKIVVDLVNQVQKDKQDGDVDIRVEIAPNATYVVTAISFTPTDESDEDKYSKLTEEDEKFMGDLNATIELTNEFARDEINSEEIEGKNKLMVAVWKRLEDEINDLKLEHEKKHKYATIKIAKRGDVTLLITKSYIKEGDEIIVDLGLVSVDLEKVVVAEENKKNKVKGDLFPKMQPYRDDVWSKGPHLDVKRKDDKKKITEAKLDLVEGDVVWLQFGNMGKATSSDLDKAARLIAGLFGNSTIMTQAISQLHQAIERCQSIINDTNSNKKEKEFAERTVSKFERMLELI